MASLQFLHFILPCKQGSSCNPDLQDAALCPGNGRCKQICRDDQDCGNGRCDPKFGCICESLSGLCYVWHLQLTGKAPPTTKPKHECQCGELSYSWCEQGSKCRDDYDCSNDKCNPKLGCICDEECKVTTTKAGKAPPTTAAAISMRNLLLLFVLYTTFISYLTL